MDIRKLQRAIVDGLEDVKAQHIVVFNTEHLSALFERVIIASGTSNRQTKSLAASVRDAVRGAGFPVLRTEGESNGEWIIVDCGAAVVHVMQPTIREYYHLEEIWGGKPVNVKLGQAGSGKLVKASDDVPVSRKVPAGAKKGAASTQAAAPGKTPSRAKRAAPAPAPAPAPAAKAPARRAPAAQAPVRKGAAPKAGVTRTTGVKSTAAKTAPAKHVPTKGVARTAPKGAAKPAGKTIVVKKAAAKKGVAKKGVAKKSAVKTAARKTASR